MKKVNLQIPVLLLIVIFIFGCSGGTEQTANQSVTDNELASDEIVDDGKGVGEITHVELNDPLDEEMINEGREIYEMKCAACHKLSAQRVVGPGWAGVTSVRKPEWIMNMITNVEIMLEEDATAQALLEDCLTRMPNQNVSVEDARKLLEFMIDNDQNQQ